MAIITGSGGGSTFDNTKNEENISNNTDDIEDNSSDIEGNLEGIGDNSTSISDLLTRITELETERARHYTFSETINNGSPSSFLVTRGPYQFYLNAQPSISDSNGIQIRNLGRSCWFTVMYHHSSSQTSDDAPVRHERIGLANSEVGTFMTIEDGENSSGAIHAVITVVEYSTNTDSSHSTLRVDMSIVRSSSTERRFAGTVHLLGHETIDGDSRP